MIAINPAFEDNFYRNPWGKSSQEQSPENIKSDEVDLSELFVPYSVNNKIEIPPLQNFFRIVKEGYILDLRNYLARNSMHNLDEITNYEKDGEEYKGIRALGIAALEDNISMIKFLLRMGADINAGETCAELAAFQNMENSKEALKVILDYKKEKKIKTEVEKMSSIA